VAGIAVPLIFLFCSMNKQFHKITRVAGPDDGERADGEEVKDLARTSE
jgi:hypothetical protein